MVAERSGANAMRRLCTISVLLLALTSVGFNLKAEDPLENSRKDWGTQKRALEVQWESLQSQIERQWDELEKAQQERWTRLKAEVEQKWEKFFHSTKKDWVEYNQAKDARSRVNFEKGKVVLEVVVQEGDPMAIERARGKITDQAEKIFSRQNVIREIVLENQVVNKKGDRVGPRNLKDFLKEEVLPEIKPDPSPYQSRDGAKRRKYTVHLDMVPNHIRIRAEKYLPIVKRNAGRFRLKPQLILAIIHTESYFNPMALSHCNAVGIMQVIPRYAGREAYRFVHKVDRVITREYLYNPENNIELGSAYLHLLKYQHFSDVPGELKNRYVSICGYNWGPTSMHRRIVDRYPISQMSDREVYLLLRRKTPRETRDYIKKVTKWMPIYDPFFDRR